MLRLHLGDTLFIEHVAAVATIGEQPARISGAAIPARVNAPHGFRADECRVMAIEGKECDDGIRRAELRATVAPPALPVNDQCVRRIGAAAFDRGRVPHAA